MATEFQKNLGYLINQTGLSNRDFSRELLGREDGPFISRLLSEDYVLPTKGTLKRLANYCRQTFNHPGFQPEHIDEHHDRFVMRSKGLIPPDCIPIPDSVSLNWTTQPSFYERIWGPETWRGRYILYYYNRAWQAVFGNEFIIADKEDTPIHNGIRFTLNDGPPNSTAFDGVIYQILTFSYFIAWPKQSPSELVFGILEFSANIEQYGAIGQLIAVQDRDKNKTESGQHMFGSKIRLVPFPYGATPAEQAEFLETQIGRVDPAHLDAKTREICMPT